MTDLGPSLLTIYKFPLENLLKQIEILVCVFLLRVEHQKGFPSKDCGIKMWRKERQVTCFDVAMYLSLFGKFTLIMSNTLPL